MLRLEIEPAFSSHNSSQGTFNLTDKLPRYYVINEIVLLYVVKIDIFTQSTLFENSLKPLSLKPYERSEIPISS